MQKFINLTIQKAEERLVEGFASVELPDDQGGVFQGRHYVGDVVDAAGLQKALPEYMAWGNLREMHQTSAVGVVIKAEIIPGEVEVEGRRLLNPLHIVARIIDEAAWQKVKTGVYKGFSIGGQVIRAALEKMGDALVRRVTELSLTEISIVDRPANPHARILLWKSAGDPAGNNPTNGGETVTKRLEKAADPAKSLAALQALRDETETNGDLEGAALYTQAIALLLQASGEAGEPPEEPSQDEPSDEAGESAAGEADAAAPAEDPRLEMAAQGAPLAQPQTDAPAQTPQPLRKAGRTFSASNQTAMHKVIQALANMLAGSGDSTAGAVLKCYGGPDREDGPQPKTAAASLPLDESALRKALADSPALAQMTGALEKVTQAVTDLAARVEKYEALPASGGPALRAVAEKALPLSAPVETGKSQSEPEITKASLADLRKAVALEPNPVIRAGLIGQLREAEAAYRARN